MSNELAAIQGLPDHYNSNAAMLSTNLRGKFPGILHPDHIVGFWPPIEL
jgi:hypothetical protein